MIKQISGSQMISEALHEEGVEIVFGYPGGAALNIYDETYKQTYFKPFTQQTDTLGLVAKLAWLL